jgi:hypothetical protein
MNARQFGYAVISTAAVSFLCLAPVNAQAQGRGGRQRAADSEATVSTPMTADGHPDLSGLWNGGRGMAAAADDGAAEPADKNVIKSVLNARGGSLANFERDNSLTRRMDPNKPVYKPQYWTLVQSLDQTGNDADPTYTCMPAGLPRKGPPMKIIQLPKETIFLYAGGALGMYRVIPTDGRPHSPDDKLEGTWYGESIGHWEGNTFVVDTVGFNNTSWLGIAGWIHGDNLHVTERITREGNKLTWQATAEDPDYFLQPYTTSPATLRINNDPQAVIDEALPCSERDLAHLTTKEHH